MKYLSCTPFLILISLVTHASALAAGNSNGRVLYSGANRLLGHGYDSKSEDYRANCFIDQSSLAYSYGATQFSRIDQSTDTQSSNLETEFGFALNTRARFGLSSISNEASYLESVSDTEVQESFTVGFEVVSKDAAIDLTGEGKGIKLLQPRYLALLKKKKGEYYLTSSFLETCGDEFVHSVKRGVKVYVSVVVKFTNKKHLKEFTNTFSAKAKWGKLDFTSDSLSSSLKKSGSIKLTALQVGGDPFKLSDILVSHGGEGKKKTFPLVECSLENLQACKDAYKDILDYIKSLQIDMGTDTFKPYEAGSSTASLNHTTVSWREMGIRGSVDMTDAAISAMRDELSGAFEAQLKDYRILVAHQSGASSRVALSDDETETLTVDLDKVRNNLSTLARAAERCYDDIDERKSVEQCTKAVGGAIAKVKERSIDPVWKKTPEQLCGAGCTQCVNTGTSKSPDYKCLRCKFEVGDKTGGKPKTLDRYGFTASCKNLPAGAAATYIVAGNHGNCGYSGDPQEGWWGELAIEASSGTSTVRMEVSAQSNKSRNMANASRTGIIPESGIVEFVAGSGTCQSPGGRHDYTQDLDADFTFEVNTPDLLIQYYGTAN